MPGATVHYTVTITDTGQTPYTGITVTDSLSGLLDDAAYNGDAAATTGSVSYTSPNLTWTGTLAPGAAATVTFTVTVNNPDTGNQVLATLLTSAAAGNNCLAGSTDPSCATSVPVERPPCSPSPSAPTSPRPSRAARCTTRSPSPTPPPTPYAGAAFTDDLTGVLDDASYNADATASTGTVLFTSPALTWTGTVPPPAPPRSRSRSR